MMKNKKIIALLVIIVIAIGLAFIPFKSALANGTYTYTLTFTATPGHSVEVVDNHLIIDGNNNIVELLNSSNESIGTVASVSEGVATITVTNGDEGVLNFNGSVFSLHDGTSTYNYGALNSSTNFSVQAPASGGGTESTSFNVNFGSASWVIGEATVTAAIAGKTINNSTAVAINNNDIITLTNFDPSTMRVGVRETGADPQNAFSTTLGVNNNSGVYETSLQNIDPEVHLPTNLDFYVEAGSAEPSGGDQLGENNTVWFVWKKSNGDLGKYQVTGLTRSVVDDQTGLVTYTTKYIKASDVAADFDLDAVRQSGEYLWIWEDAFINNHIADMTTANELAEFLETSGIQNDYDAWKAFAIDPCGASDGNSIISTNGDRAFRATIYDNNEYYGISNASTPQELTYFPGFWDPGFFNPAYDLSKTTVSNPARIQTYLLEPKIVLKNDAISAPIDNIELVSDILPAAVTITNKNDGSFEIVFNCNYYENVEFKVTSGGKTYYLMIDRVTVNCFRNEENKAGVELYVPDGDANDYEIIETWYFKDGSEMQCNLTAEGTYQGGVNIQARSYVRTEAENAKINLRPDSSNVPTGVLYTVVKSGSTAEEYKGTLSGSGKGTYFSYNEGRFTLGEQGGLM